VEGRWLTIPGSGERWARSWVAEEEVGDADPGVLLLPADGRFIRAGLGPEADIPLPSVWLLGDSLVEGERQVELAIRSRLGAEMIGIHLPGNGGEIVCLGGTLCPSEGGGGPVRTLTHWGVPEGAYLSVTLRIKEPSSPMAVDVLEHDLRPRELLGEGFFRRDPSIIANAPAGSDRMVQRTRAHIPSSRQEPGS
jgi:hypothetical protein